MAAWVFWTLLTIVSWGIWAILSKLIGDELSPAHSQVISTIGIVPIIGMLWLSKDAEPTRNLRRGVWLAIASGIISCLGNIAYYDVLNRGSKAAAVIPITALYPTVTVLLAVPILKERLTAVQLVGVGLSLVAIYLFNVTAEQGVFTSWLLFALIPIALWGVCGLLQKMSTNYISARTSAIWFLAAFLPVAGIIMFSEPLPAGVSIRTWALAMALGFTLALGNFTILLAFSSGGKASIIAPLAGLYPLVSIPIAMAVLGERMSWREEWRELLGMACALVAVVLLSLQSQSDTPKETTDQPRTLP